MSKLRSTILIILFLLISTSNVSFQIVQRPVWMEQPGTLDTTFSCREDVSFPIPTAIDPISGEKIKVSIKNKFNVSGKCEHNHLVNIEYIAINGKGVSSIPYWVKVKVVDYTPPTWTIPFYSLDTIYTCAENLIKPKPPPAIDNCTDQKVTIRLVEEIIHEGVCPNQFTQSYTYVAQDDCGNESIPFGIHIIVNDDTAPHWKSLPGQLDTIYNDSDQFEFPRLPVAVDNCSGNPIRVILGSDIRISIVGPNEYVRKLGYEAMDGCGNTSERYDVLVTIQDTSLVGSINH